MIHYKDGCINCRLFTKKNVLCSWEFMTTDYDVGFGVYHKSAEMKSKKVHAGDMAVVVSAIVNLTSF